MQTRQSPYIDAFHAHHPVRITLDSGATGNMIRHSLVRRLGGHLSPSSQSAHQADRCSPLKAVGETRLSFTRANREFSFEGLVVENLDVDVLAGTPFMETNDISIRLAKRQVTIGDDTSYAYGSQAPAVTSIAARRAIVLLPLQPFGLATSLKLTYPMMPLLTACMLSSHVMMPRVYES